MGSACCVAARPKDSRLDNDGRSTASPDTPSSHWDYKSQADDFSVPSNFMQVERDLSLSSRASRVASFRHLSHQRNHSGNLSIDSSPSDSFRAPQWLNSPIRASLDGDFVNVPSDSILSPYRASSYAKEGCLCVGPSTVSNMLQSFPSSSNTSDCPPRWSKRQPSSSRRHSIRNHSFFSRRSRHNSSHHLARQISDSRIHSLNAQNGSPIQVFDGRHSFKWSTSTGDSAVGSHGGASDWWSMQTFSDLVASSRRERLRWIDATSPSDFGWVLGRESMDRVSLAEERIRDINCQAPSMSSHVDVQTCGICSKLLSQRSPSSSETMMAANDLSVVAVLVCGHVYHAECLEQITSEASRQDPACPICVAREKMPSKRLTSPVEQLNKTKGGSLMAYRSQSQSSTRNKMSRIGVSSDDLGGPEFFSGGISIPSRDQVSGNNVVKPSTITEKSSMIKPLFKKHFSFGGKS